MHEERVPNPSRWTQFAALGRSSPSGMRWSARTRRKAATTSSPSAGAPSVLAHQVDLARGLAEGAVLEHVDPRRQGHRGPAGVRGEVDEEQRGAVAHQQPRPVVVRRPVSAQERRRRRRGRCRWRASARGSSPRERLVGSLASPSGWLVSPAHTPCSLTASQVPPESSSRPPRTRGGPSSSTVIGVVGRSRTSSRLAPTIRGSPGTSCDATTRRHTVRAPYRGPGGTALPVGASRVQAPRRVASYRSGMRTRVVTLAAAAGSRPWSLLPALPASAKGLSQSQHQGPDEQHQPARRS